MNTTVSPCEAGSSANDHLPLGVLILTSNEADQFNLDRDARFLTIYANLMSILLEKFQSFEEHRQIRTETEDAGHE